MADVSKPDLSSPDQSPQHPWPMVPVLQTLTVLSDGEEEQMEQKMGIENSYSLNVPKLSSMDSSFNITPALNHQNNQKRKVGRPITSAKTMNRSFPAVDEIRAKLEAGECYVRPRASSSSSDVWALFQEVAYKETHFFTGIVQCKSCKFLTRYHGQITGTSHMRRHHCFSILFPNSTPANRKSKVQQNAANMAALNMNVDADSTTPRQMLKRLKKDISPSRSLKKVDSFNFLSSLHLNSSSQMANNSNVTIHPSLPKKLKNNHFVSQERSLMAPSSSFTLTSVNTSVSAASNGTNSSQSMLRTVNGYNSSSPSSSPHQSSSPSVNVPSNSSNSLRIQNSKQDLRERLVQFCFQELVPLKSVNSEAFRTILQSHLRLCTTQLHYQLLQQQQQHPQLMSLTSMVSSFMNHLSHQMPDAEQLRNYLDLIYGQCRDKIRQDLSSTLDNNVGGALVCDSEQDACIISVYYVDSDWRLVEAILSASAVVFDINQFVARTLENYALQDREKLSKFTFVSHGGLFDGVSLCLSSMAHIVDKVVEEALSVSDDYCLSKKLPALSDLFEACQEISSRLNISIEPLPYDVDWISKYELLKLLLQQRSQISSEDIADSSISFDLISELVELLEPFRTASNELRQCFKHPTLSHVLLYFYKLKKVLSSPSSTSLPLQSQATNLSVKRNGHMSVNNKRIKRKKSSDNIENSDSDSEEEVYINDKQSAMKKSDQDTRNNEFSDEELKDEEEAEEESCKDPNWIILLIDNLKQLLMDNLKRYYEVQSLHRIATFLWPNFRLLKMLTPDEQKEVHEDVRKLIQTRVSLKNDKNGTKHSSNENDSRESSDHSSSCNGLDFSKTKSKLDFDEWEVLSDQDQDEVDKYLSVQLTSCSENYVLQWWKEHSNEFPRMSQLAKWILAIPASVTTRERFQISNNNQVDDLLLFLHCNMRTEKFDLSTIKKSQPKTKVKYNKVSSASSASLIAQTN